MGDMTDIIDIVDFKGKKGKTSTVWKFFGFPKFAGGIVDRQKVICKLCNMVKPYHSQTTNMRNHLDRNHWKEVTEPILQATKVTKTGGEQEKSTLPNGPSLPSLPSLPKLPETTEAESSQPTVPSLPSLPEPSLSSLPPAKKMKTDDVTQPSPFASKRQKQLTITEINETRKPYDPNSSTARAINRAMAQFVALDMRPLSIVEGEGFRNLVRVLDPRVHVLTRNTLLERYLVPMYNITLGKVKIGIGNATAHSFTTDAWSSSTMTSFVTTTVQYIDQDKMELKSNVLDTHAVSGSHTAEKLASEMNVTVIKWGLKNVVGVSDNASNIQRAFELYKCPHIGCACHTINLSVSKGLEDSSIKRLLGKVRSLVATFKTSYIKTELLHANQKAQDLKNLQLIQDVCTRWNSSFYMIDRLLGAYPAVYATLYGGPQEKLLLTDEERKALEQLTTILQPFEKATKRLSAEKVPTAGLIMPYFERFLNKDLVVKEQDLPMIKRVKDLISKDLNKRYQKPETRSLLALTSVLDPRVRSLDWMTEDQRDLVYNDLRSECLKQLVMRGTSTPLPLPVVKQEPGTTAVKLEPVEQDTDSDDDFDGVIFVRVDPPKTDQQIINEEVAKYMQEPSLGLAYKDPLFWWRGSQHLYPNLSKLMLRYLNIPASSVPSERVFSTAGGVFSKRDSLAPDNADLLVFLYHNFRKYKCEVMPEWSALVQ